MASPQHLTMIENLPVEVLADIFIRIVAKQLAQMRCVCKPWNALLSDPSFINETFLFFRHGCSFECRLFTTTSLNSELTEFIKLPVKPQPKHTYGRIIGFANGLICFRYRSSHNDLDVHIWNPSLSAVLTLPPSSLPVNDLMEIHLRFGYDPKTDDYKVVKLTTISESPTQTEVYSMRKGSWELIPPQGFPCHVTLISHGDEVCVVDNAHWFCFTDRALNSQTMVAFDLSAETFREIPLPDSIIPHCEYRSVEFGVSGGKLCVMLGSRDGSCEVWVMNEYGVAESWVKHHAFSQFNGDITPYNFTSQREFLFCVDKNDNRFALYDLVTANTKTFKIKGVFGTNKVVEYVDSLVWVAPPKHKMSCYNISQL